jgi:hypothetical protein
MPVDMSVTMPPAAGALSTSRTQSPGLKRLLLLTLRTPWPRAAFC